MGNRASSASTAPPQRFTLLTYNVAGLPHWLSASRPHAHAALLSPRLNRYDIVLLQEDFVYHKGVTDQAQHAHRSTPNYPRVRRPHLLAMLGDGLNRLSRYPVERFERVPWAMCHGIVSNGADCLAAKGFTYGRHSLGGALVIDIYNVHCDAGHSSGDRAARRAQVEQLAEYMRAHTDASVPCIVAGDTNLDVDVNTYDRETLQRFLVATGLRDSKADAGVRENAQHRRPLASQVDMVLYRSGRPVRLRVDRWRVCTDEFVTDTGTPLSDHNALCVEFSVSSASSHMTSAPMR